MAQDPKRDHGELASTPDDGHRADAGEKPDVTDKAGYPVIQKSDPGEEPDRTDKAGYPVVEPR
jgi:hypothetical protein